MVGQKAKERHELRERHQELQEGGHWVLPLSHPAEIHCTTAQTKKDPRTMYKTIKQLRGGQTQRANLIKDGSGNLLIEPEKIAGRWREYFAALLNDVEEQHPLQPPAN